MPGTIISGARELPLGDLMTRAAKVARGLHALGIGPNDSIALMLRNDFAFFEASLGAGLLGAYAVPVNWHNKDDEAGYIVRDCGAKALIAHADLLPQVEAGLPDGIRTMVVETPIEVAAAYAIPSDRLQVPAGAVDFDAWRETFEPWSEPPKPPPQAIIYTSGTTGRPKGVRRQPPTMQQIDWLVALNREVFGMGPDMRCAISGPMYHSAPNFYGIWAARSGAELIVMQPRFDAEELLHLIDRHRLNNLYLVPTMFVRLLKLPDTVRRRYDVSSLKAVVHAAAPCPPDVKARMIDWWGPVINEFYGCTESGAVTFVTGDEARRKPGTVGRVVGGATVKILDAEGREAPPNTVGEVFALQPSFPDFTYHGDDAKRRAAEKAGLISCGDVGEIDADGYLFLRDRAKDMIISGGVNIYPAEIEAVLHNMPGLYDVAVFGIPDDEYGESICAAVQLQPGAAVTEQDIRAFVRQHMAGYKVPKRVDFHPQLPREDSGKVFKRKLREPYWADKGRRI